MDAQITLPDDGGSAVIKFTESDGQPTTFASPADERQARRNVLAKAVTDQCTRAANVTEPELQAHYRKGQSLAAKALKAEQEAVPAASALTGQLAKAQPGSVSVKCPSCQTSLRFYPDRSTT